MDRVEPTFCLANAFNDALRVAFKIEGPASNGSEISFDVWGTVLTID